jgi:hypothetical protein
VFLIHFLIFSRIFLKVILELFSNFDQKNGKPYAIKLKLCNHQWVSAPKLLKLLYPDAHGLFKETHGTLSSFRASTSTSTVWTITLSACTITLTPSTITLFWSLKHVHGLN